MNNLHNIKQSQRENDLKCINKLDDKWMMVRKMYHIKLYSAGLNINQQYDINMVDIFQSVLIFPLDITQHKFFKGYISETRNFNKHSWKHFDFLVSPVIPYHKNKAFLGSFGNVYGKGKLSKRQSSKIFVKILGFLTVMPTVWLINI